MKKIIDKLAVAHHLEKSDLKSLLLCENAETNKYLQHTADIIRKNNYSNFVYIRGLIEFTNYCKNDCYYCGIRNGNDLVSRYRLTNEQILECCNTGYNLGFRTFVLQGGEDTFWTDDRLCFITDKIKSLYPDCALTLSAGEKSRESYQRLFDAGTDRYLLRHETADSYHYSKLHPKYLTLENRIECLYNLKDIGYQTGCGFMVGSPFQTIDNIITDLQFIENFKPEMVGIGPFLPAENTPFAEFKPGNVDLTLRILSIIRLLLPKVLLPATTALGTAETGGRERGIMAGANVVMPNLSPAEVREKYLLYNGKIATNTEAAEGVLELKHSLDKIGYKIVTSRGDYGGSSQ